MLAAESKVARPDSNGSPNENPNCSWKQITGHVEPFLQAVKDQHIRENRICRVFVSPRISGDSSFGKVTRAVTDFIQQYAGR